MARYLIPPIVVALGLALVGYLARNDKPAPQPAYGQQATQPAQVDPKAGGADVWRQISTGGYQGWAPFPGLPAGYYQGTQPHGALLKIYANRAMFTAPDQPPDGTIIVKENYGNDRRLATVTLMRKVKGFDPANQDWWWGQFGPGGLVQESGVVPACIGCHRNAQGGDYLFSNDKGRSGGK